MPVVALQHHDSVVHDNPDDQDQTKHGNHVQAKAENTHDGNPREQRSGNRQSGDQRPPPTAQEPQYDQHHETGGEKDGLHQVGDVLFNVLRIVHGHPVLQPGRKALGDSRHSLAHGAGEGHRVGIALFDHTEAHRDLAREASYPSIVLHAIDGFADIRNAHRCSVAVGDDEVVHGPGRGELPLRLDQKLAVDALDPTGGNIHVVAADRLYDVLHGEVVGGELRRIQAYPYRVAAFTADQDLPDAAGALQPLLDGLVRILGQPDLIPPLVTGQRDPHDGPRFRVELAHDRLLDVVGQLAAGAVHSVAHVLGGDVDVAPQLEFGDDRRDFLSGFGGQLLQTLDCVDLLLQQRDDLGLDDLRLRPGEHDVDADDGEVDVREFAHRHVEVAVQPEDGDDQEDDDRQDRSSYAEVPDHGRSSGSAPEPCSRSVSSSLPSMN